MRPTESQKILVTGFEPFGGRSLNPSQLLLDEVKRDCNFVEILTLPVHFERAFSTFKEYWENHRQEFKAVLLLGQAAGRRGISLERVALNWMHSEKNDLDGNTIPTGRIIEGAPEAYIIDFFPDEWRDLLKEVSDTHISLSAGAYVCNNLYFQVIHYLTKKEVPTLFVHVPLLPEQTLETDKHSPVMSLVDQKKVLLKILQLLKDLGN